MPTTLGAHHPRVEFARQLLSKKGRREHGRFSFEGPTLLDEALRSRVAIEALYATRRAYDDAAQVRALESSGTPVYLVDERTFAKLSDLDTPSGL
ncbi:MAG: RNA methyltransferase substrate-binding domain-containing protein, partial [Vulcanimicrobiaceae bacterium]